MSTMSFPGFGPLPAAKGSATSSSVITGKQFSPQQQVLLYSSDEWEEFILEWVNSQTKNYLSVQRFTGAGDMGIDIAGFVDKDGLMGVWDNYQCKHYGQPLPATTAVTEIGKILWYSFNKKYVPPRKHYFVAPQDCGTKLIKLLSKPADLQKYVFDNWDTYCLKKITSTQDVKLEDTFRDYAEYFDYSIFTSKKSLDVITDHNTTPFYTGRFGGGLKPRPTPMSAPATIAAAENRYVQQLFDVYSEERNATVASLSDLSTSQELTQHFHRQREMFYHAESLRNFARDNVPSGTYENLMSEVHAGVIEVESAAHSTSMKRLTEVTQAAVSLHLTASPLISVTMVQDKKGICHQLANDDKLRWKK